MSTPPTLNYDQYQFQTRPLIFKADGHANGFSFEERRDLHVHIRKSFARRGSPPSWAMNTSALKLLLARFLELRANIRFAGNGTPEERILRAQKLLKKARPALIERRREIVALKSAGGSAKLERAIKEIDTQLAVSKDAALIVCGVVHYYVRCGYRASDTAAALKNVISCSKVSHIAGALQNLWERMQSGKDRKPKANPLGDSRARWRREGKCVSCGRAKETEKRHCNACRERGKDYEKKRHQKHRAKRLLRMKKYARRHKAERARRESTKRERRLAAGLCLRCGKRPPSQNSPRCQECKNGARDDARAERLKRSQAGSSAA